MHWNIKSLSFNKALSYVSLRVIKCFPSDFRSGSCSNITSNSICLIITNGCSTRVLLNAGWYATYKAWIKKRPLFPVFKTTLKSLWDHLRPDVWPVIYPPACTIIVPFSYRSSHRNPTIHHNNKPPIGSTLFISCAEYLNRCVFSTTAGN